MIYVTTNSTLLYPTLLCTILLITNHVNLQITKSEIIYNVNFFLIKKLIFFRWTNN